MSNLIVEPGDVVPNVLAQWDRVDAANIALLARDLERKWAVDGRFDYHALNADAHLLAGLSTCKKLNNVKTLPSLTKLWLAVKEPAKSGLGGIILGEDSRHYRAVLTFVERLFLPHLLATLEHTFDSLAASAAKRETAEARVRACHDAASRLAEMFDEFDFETVAVQQRVEDKCGLLHQMADAEAT